MKRNEITTVLIIVIFLCCSCDPNVNDKNSLLVVTSIQPVSHWVQAVAGTEVRIITLLPANANPHTFELLPRQIRDAAQAQLLVTIGAGLEPWAGKLVQNMLHEGAANLVLSENEELLQTALNNDHSRHHNDAHDSGNPHLWLDPLFAIKAVEKIADILIKTQPEKKTLFTENARIYTDSLLHLHNNIIAVTSAWKNRGFVADHSSWVYFAERYSLHEEGTIEKQPGREISARELATLITTMREHSIKAIFADMRSNTRSVEVLAEESGARIAFLDPLGGAMTSAGYITLMEKNVEAMNEVMK